MVPLSKMAVVENFAEKSLPMVEEMKAWTPCPRDSALQMQAGLRGTQAVFSRIGKLFHIDLVQGGQS